MRFIRFDRLAAARLRNRPAVTLLELMITIVVLGGVLGITSLSLAGEKSKSKTPSSMTSRIAALRAAAVTSGSTQTVTLNDSSSAVLVTALPDGRIIADIRNLDRMAGTRGVDETH